MESFRSSSSKQVLISAMNSQVSYTTVVFCEYLRIFHSFS